MAVRKLKIIITLLLLVACEVITAQTRQKILLPVKQDGKWGYIDTQGRVVVAPIYDFAGDFENSNFAKVQLNGVVYALDREGNRRDIRIPLAMKNDLKGFVFFLDSFILHKQAHTGKWAMYNLDFATIYPYEYDSIYTIGKDRNSWLWGANSGRIVLKKDSLLGIGNTAGDIIMQPIYTAIYRNWGYHYEVRIGDKAGLYTAEGKEILPVKFNVINSYYPNDKYVIAMLNDEGWGIYDIEGNTVLGHGWGGIRPITAEYALVNTQDSTWLFSFANKKLLYVNGFIGFGNQIGNGLMVNTANGKGILGNDGNFIVPPQYTYIYTSADHWLVFKNRLWGMLDANANIVFEPQFTYLDQIQDNVALIRQDSLWGLVNIWGEIVVPAKYKDIDLYNNTAKATIGKTVDIYELKDNGKLDDLQSFKNVMTIRVQTRSDELMRRSRTTRQAVKWANTIVDIDSIGFSSTRGWFKDSATLRWGLKDARGTVVIPPQYDRIETTDSSHYTIVHINRNPPVKVDLFGVEVEFSSLKGLVDHHSAVILAKPVFLYIDEEVLSPQFTIYAIANRNYSTPNYAMALFQDGTFSVITADGRIKKGTGFRFADKKYDGITRVFSGNVGNVTANCDKWGNGLDQCVNLHSYIRSLGGKIINESRDKGSYITFIKGSWAYIDHKGNTRETGLKLASNFSSGKAIVQSASGFYGLINNKFIYTLTPQYDEITYLPRSEKKQLLVKVNKQLQGYVDTKGEMLTGVIFTQTTNFSNSRAWAIEDVKDKESPFYQKYTLIDTFGLQVGKVAFEQVREFRGGYAAVYENSRWGFIDINADTIAPLIYRRVGNFSEGLAWVNKNGKIGYIDETGEMVIAPKYRRAEEFSNGLAAVMADGNYGYINPLGEYVVEPTLTKALQFDEEGYAIAYRKNRMGLLDKTGQWVLQPHYKTLQHVLGTMYVASKGKHHLLYDAQAKKGKKLPRYSSVTVNKAGYIEVKKGARKTGLLDADGTMVVNDMIRDFHKADAKLIVAGARKAVGAISHDGDTLISFDNLKVETAGEGFLKILQRGKGWALYGSDGQTIACCYAKIGAFKDGFAPAQTNEGKWGMINTLGVWVAQPLYASIYPVANGFFRVSMNAVNMICDLNGNFITNGAFESLEYIKDANLYRIQQRNRIGYFTAQGQWLWQLRN